MKERKYFGGKAAEKVRGTAEKKIAAAGAAAACIMSLFLGACTAPRQAEAPASEDQEEEIPEVDLKIETKIIDGSGNITDAGNGEVPDTEVNPDFAQIPVFFTEEGKKSEAAEELNEEIGEFTEPFGEQADSAADGNRIYSSVRIYSFSEDDGRFIQVSMISDCRAGEEELLPIGPGSKDESDVRSIAYDRETGEKISCEQAMERLETASDEFAINVNSAYEQGGLREQYGKLTKTEMEGFHLDGSGSPDRIYMKLEMETETEDPVSRSGFFEYIPENGSISVISMNYDTDTLRNYFETGK